MSASVRSLIIIGVTAVLTVLAIRQWGWGGESFDPERWRGGDRSTKAAMAEDLIRSDVLLGLTESEVTRVLGAGEPCSEGPLSQIHYLTHESGEAPRGGRQWLAVEFDDSGRVDRVFVLTD